MKKKTFMGIIALILAAALTIAAGIGSAVDGKWFKNPHFETWFNSWGKDEKLPDDPDTPPAADSGSDGLLVSDIVSRDVFLASARIAPEDFKTYGVSAQADSAYTLTATVLPEDTTDKSVVCSLAFVNANSTWAKGKTVSDYITVTGSNPFTITCKQSFGEAVKLTVTSNSNSECTANCTLNYIKTVTSVSVSVNPSKITFKSSGTTAHTITATPAWSVGTIQPTFTVTGGTLQAHGRFDYYEYDEDDRPLYPVVDYSFTGATLNVGNPVDVIYGSGIHSNDLSRYVITTANGTNDCTLSVKYTVTYTAASYSKTDTSNSINVGFNVSGVVIKATSVELDKDNFYFGG